MTSIDKFIGTEFRSRYVNPTWIEGMKKEGYAGAGEMKAFVEYLWGWDATAPEVIDDQKWQETFDVYVQDKHKLGMAQFFEKKSPFAYQDMTARMIETVRKGYWKADEATHKKLLEEYVESVNRHGVGCAENTCGNPRLQKYVLDEGRKVGHSGADARRVPPGAGTRHRDADRVGRRGAVQLRALERRADGRQPVEGAGPQPRGPPARGLPDGTAGNRSKPAARAGDAASSGAYLPLRDRRSRGRAAAGLALAALAPGLKYPSRRMLRGARSLSSSSLRRAACAPSPAGWPRPAAAAEQGPPRRRDLTHVTQTPRRRSNRAWRRSRTGSWCRWYDTRDGHGEIYARALSADASAGRPRVAPDQHRPRRLRSRRARAGRARLRHRLVREDPDGRAGAPPRPVVARRPAALDRDAGAQRAQHRGARGRRPRLRGVGRGRRRAAAGVWAGWWRATGRWSSRLAGSPTRAAPRGTSTPRWRRRRRRRRRVHGSCSTPRWARSPTRSSSST